MAEITLCYPGTSQPCTHPRDILLAPMSPLMCTWPARGAPLLLLAQADAVWDGGVQPGLGNQPDMRALPPCAPSEETSQELSTGRAAPGHRQGDKAQLAVEAQLLPVGVTDLAEHSP